MTTGKRYIDAEFRGDTSDLERASRDAAGDLDRVADQADQADRALLDMAGSAAAGAEQLDETARASRKVTKDVDDARTALRRLDDQLDRLDGRNVDVDVNVDRDGHLKDMYDRLSERDGILGQLGKLGGKSAAGGAFAVLAGGALAASAATAALGVAVLGAGAAMAAAAIPLVVLVGAAEKLGVNVAAARGSIDALSAAGRELGAAFVGAAAPALNEVWATFEEHGVPALETITDMIVANKDQIQLLVVNLGIMAARGVQAFAAVAKVAIMLADDLGGPLLSALAAVMRATAGYYRLLSHIPGMGWMADMADGMDAAAEGADAARTSIGIMRDVSVPALDEVGDAAGKMGDDLDRAAVDRTSVIRVKVDTAAIDAYKAKFGQYPYVPGGRYDRTTASTGIAAAARMTSAAPSAPVVNVQVDARGAVGLDAVRLGEIVAAGIGRHTRRNGSWWNPPPPPRVAQA